MVALGACCRVVNGTTPAAGDDSHWKGDVVWITPTDLGKIDGVYINGSARTISRNALDSHNLTLCPPGSVVLSSRAPIGHLGIAAVPLCTNQGCKTLVPGDGVKPEYLYYALLRAVPDLKALGSGATFAEVSKAQVEGFEIPLPPLAEQERIAGWVSRGMERASAARRAALDRLVAAEALPAALLREVFEGPAASGWETRRIDEVCDLLPSKSIASDGDTQVRAITTACLTERGFRPEGVKTARMRAADVPLCTVRSGEILIARSNTPDLVGRASIYLGEPQNIVASDLTIRLWARNSEHDARPEYLAAYMSFLFQTGYWKERAGGASGSMKKITREQLSAEVVPLPDLHTQRRLAAELTQRLAAAEGVIARCREELAAIKALPAALLREAFNPMEQTNDQTA